jgi:hypothetical protein
MQDPNKPDDVHQASGSTPPSVVRRFVSLALRRVCHVTRSAAAGEGGSLRVAEARLDLLDQQVSASAVTLEQPSWDGTPGDWPPRVLTVGQPRQLRHTDTPELSSVRGLRRHLRHGTAGC